MINYILQVILFQVLFLAIYDFFLSKETFFTKNRWYLLSTSIVSFLIPLIKIPSFQKAVSKEYVVNFPEIVLSPERVIQRTIQTTPFQESVNYVAIVFWLGVGVFSMLFLLKFAKIINLIVKYNSEKHADFTLIVLPNQSKAFSFFNYIFLGKDIPDSQKEKIIQHELVHNKQKHSLDLIFFEILKIVMWFNPMIYFYQKRITLVHEYISDAVVSKSETKETYINNLLSSFFQVENIAFINQFYKQSFIKKRIIMMTKTQSKKMNQLKYLVLIPVLVSMLFYSSCSETDNISSEFKGVIPEKSTQISYIEIDGKVSVGHSDKKSYLDSYLGNGIPDGIEVTYEELNSFERGEFDFIYNRIKTNQLAGKTFVKTLKIYQKKNGRKTVQFIIDPNSFIKPKEKREMFSDGSYSVLHVQKTPIFLGCNERDIDCFFKKLDEHFNKNFNIDITKNLGLSSGKKKVFVSFNIDTNGNVADINVKAPHEIIKKEVEQIMSSLPKMSIGENDGKPVKVKYTLPFLFQVE